MFLIALENAQSLNIIKYLVEQAEIKGLTKEIYIKKKNIFGCDQLQLESSFAGIQYAIRCSKSVFKYIKKKFPEDFKNNFKFDRSLGKEFSKFKFNGKK